MLHDFKLYTYVNVPV